MTRRYSFYLTAAISTFMLIIVAALSVAGASAGAPISALTPKAPLDAALPARLTLQL